MVFRKAVHCGKRPGGTRGRASPSRAEPCAAPELSSLCVDRDEPKCPLSRKDEARGRVRQDNEVSERG